MSESKRTLKSRSAFALTLLALAAIDGPAVAQMRLDRYLAPLSPRDGLRLARPVGLDEQRFAGLLVLDYADDPLVMELERGREETETTRLVDTQLEAQARVAYGVTKRLMLSAGLDFAVVMVGDSYRDATTSTALTPADGAGIGDAQLGARYVLLGAVDSPASLAIDANVGLPLARGANSRQFSSGEHSVTFRPDVLSEVRFGAVRIVGNLGVVVRQDTRLIGTRIGDELTLGLGASLRLPGQLKDFELMAEAYGATAWADPFGRDATPMEALAGGRWHPAESWVVSAAAGPGMGRGIGSPDLRAIASLGFVGAGDPDSDGDLILDADDSCPTDAEDRDGLQDDDGCPDLDDDGDGVSEPLDRCPTAAEDKDGVEDQDGCPDLDDDRDGVADASDRCPAEAEDVDSFQDEDGCPDPDNDGDGVADASDRCAGEAEDVDSFQDEDGCPDPDNDGDGVPDASDECRDTAGTAEQRGCAPAMVEAGQIRLNQSIAFELSGATLLPESEAILEQVRLLLEKNPQIEAIAVEGHTDGTGSASQNQKLSERRAQSVVRWLQSHGVAAARLSARGCGSTHPLGDDASEEARSKNRRVELHIIEPGKFNAPVDGCVLVPSSAK
jgi:outer membrane protein OmpA-like peptidoglycan-associated protein